MPQENQNKKQPEPTFLIGGFHKGDASFMSNQEMCDIFKKLEDVMIEHKLIQINVSINPYLFPKILL